MARDDAGLPGSSRSTIAGSSGSVTGSEEHLRAPGERVGRYEIGDVLGRGGMGIVYAAYDPELERNIALKVLHARGGQADAMLLREAQALARLSHPGVVTVHDVGAWEGHVFVAMERVPGVTLRAWVRASSPSTSRTLAVLMRAGEGLLAAHRAGLVHRDFKPDNVMVADAARGLSVVRVMDFGLARMTQELESSGAVALDADARTLEPTSIGHLVGTPAYMAPEQFAGVPADARTDQFGFCVTAWEVLYGSRPFQGKSLAELACAVASGTPRPPPPGTDVPAFIERALRRGLSPSPDDRWPDMQALLRALARDRRTGRRRLAGLGLVLVASTLVALRVGSVGAAPRCEDADARLDGVWDDARREQVQQALLATEVAYAGQTAAAVRGELDAYAAAWATMHARTCDAIQLRADRNDDTLDRRMACLDNRRSELDAIVSVLAAADAEIVERAVAATSALASVARCADASASAMELAAPDDPTLAVDVAAVRAGLAQVVALASAGRLHAAEPMARALVEHADATGWNPVRATARLRLGDLAKELGDYPAAERELTTAYELAVDAGDDFVAAECAATLAFVVGHKGVRLDEGLTWGRQSVAIARRVGADTLVEAKASDMFGVVRWNRGELEDAESLHQRAYEIQARIRGPEHIEVAVSLMHLANVALSRQDLDVAAERYARALAIIEAALGADHPDAIIPTGNLATVRLHQRRFDEAESLLTRALRQQRTLLGEAHPDVAITMTNLGNVAMARGEHAKARGHFERALELTIAAQGKDHAMVGSPLVNLANVQLVLGEHEAAQAGFARTLELWQESLGPEHPALAYPLAGLGEARLALDRPRAAIEPLERALALRMSAPVPAADLAETRLALARALWDGGGDRRRARSLVETSRARLDAAADAAMIANMDAWLREHPSP